MSVFFLYMKYSKFGSVSLVYFIGPGPLNITFASDMLHLMLMCKIYVANSDMKNVMGMSDPNVMFKRLGPMSINCKVHIIQQQWLVGQAELKLEDLRDICFSSECLIA